MSDLVVVAADAWDPVQYERFERERSAPFFDLLDLVEPCPGGRVVDLGYGTGELTRALHERTRARSTVGLESSPAMLKRSADHAGGGLTFELGDIAEWAPSGSVDLILWNAALHWIDNHDELLTRLTGALSPGGQLAVQVPANHDLHRTGRAAGSHARAVPRGARRLRAAYARAGPRALRAAASSPRYGSQHVRLRVYLHVPPEAGAFVDWVKGTLLTDYRRRLPDRAYEEFVARYRELLAAELLAAELPDDDRSHSRSSACCVAVKARASGTSPTAASLPVLKGMREPSSRPPAWTPGPASSPLPGAAGGGSPSCTVTSS